MEKHPDFCVFILTHGRPDKVVTLGTLRNNGYEGPVFIVIDNEDKKADEYVANFGIENVIIFDKSAVADSIDEFDNFKDRRAIVYARNACFNIAQELGFKWFLELDDDYTMFKYRMNDKYQHPDSCPYIRKTLGDAIYASLEYFKSIPALSISFSQGGDWMGQKTNPVDFISGKFGFNQRKCMNSFFCCTERRFDFVGRINEDVNIYTWFQSMGNLFLTVPHIQLDQKPTQKNAGGMTEIYTNQGTYIKSFYTIMCSPSCVTIELMGETNRRMHHKIKWDNAVPLILSERHRKV